LSVAIGDSVGLGVHFDAFVSVDQFSATFVNGIDNLTVCEYGWPVDQYLVGVPPSVIEVTPATVSVDRHECGSIISGEGSAGYVGVSGGIAFDARSKRFHGSLRNGEAGGSDENGFHVFVLCLSG